MFIEAYSDVICHHGVKGQKWGVRHDKEHHGSKRHRKKYDYKAAKDEYSHLNYRVKMKKDYKTLVKEAERLINDKDKVKQLKGNYKARSMSEFIKEYNKRFDKVYGDTSKFPERYQDKILDIYDDNFIDAVNSISYRFEDDDDWAF